MDVKYGIIAGAFMTLGVTNNVGVGAVAAGEARVDIFGLGLEARAIIPAELGPKQFAIDARDYGRYELALVPCLRKWHVFLCGVAAAGFQSAAVSKLTPSTDFDPMWEVGPRLGAELGLGRNFALRAWGEVLFNPFPTSYSFKLDPTHISKQDVPFAAGFIGAAFVIKFRDYDDH